jgi:hypothetical protein
MSETTPSTSQTPSNYKDPLPPGSYIGVVKNNVDPTRSGRLQVYIQNRGASDPNNPNNWQTVIYCPPFYGTTPTGSRAGTGAFEQGNPQSYGMWFTPPDIGVQVLCLFVAGEPIGYYVGCIPSQGITHMVPAIGSVIKAQAITQNATQASYFGSSERLPVTEINNSNKEISQNPKYFDQPKPVHSYVAGILFQQGLINDQVRGSIGSTSQRESPSNCYGISTPGRAIYQGGIGAGAGGEAGITGKTLDAAAPNAATVIARRGGHTLVMDDGDLQGKDNLVRIRTSKGHQITLSDDGDCVYICHANGQAWIELGQEGTLDVYTTNSVNLRTQGTINLHADEDINMFAGGKINMKSAKGTTMQSDADMTVSNKGKLTLFSQGTIGIKSAGTVAISSQLGSWACSSELSFNGSKLQLNGGPKTEVATPTGLTKYLLPKVEFNASAGWIAQPTGLESIVTRAPTHEPYPYHNQGVSVSVKLAGPAPTPPPDAQPVPKDVKITKTGDAATTAAKTAAAKSDATASANSSGAANTAEIARLRELVVQAGVKKAEAEASLRSGQQLGVSELTLGALRVDLAQATNEYNAAVEAYIAAGGKEASRN